MPVRVFTELRNGDGFLPQLAGVADVPALEANRSYFRMELQGEAVVLEGECLIWIERGAGEVARPGGQVKGVAVPVEDREIGGEERGEPRWGGIGRYGSQ